MGGKYHTTTDSVERVRRETCTGCDDPSEQEGSEEVTLKSAGEKDGFKWIVHTEIETSIDNDTGDWRTESTVQSTNTIGSKSLFVNINQTVELTFTAYEKWDPKAA